MTAGYLLALGIAALRIPARAESFLLGFAQTPLANAAEAGLRGLVGLALMGAENHLGIGPFATLAGWFLIGTGAWMLLFPAAHRAIARSTVAWVSKRMWLIGAGAIAMAIGLVGLLARPLVD